MRSYPLTAMPSIRVTISLYLLATAQAQVALYGQCGGIGYSGSTSCVSGAICTDDNAYYYQCVPGTATASTTATSTTANIPTTTITTTSSGSSSSAASAKYFITFGDSYSMTGFNISDTKAFAGNPLGNPPLPGWTTSGGLNWIGFLVSQLNTSLILSYNFAAGGATINNSIVSGYSISMIDQVTDFSNNLASHPSYAAWTASNTLVGVWMGVNDVGNSFFQTNESSILSTDLDSYFKQLQILYNAGARNFVLLNCPPTNRSPAMISSLSSASMASLVSAISTYNSLISSKLTSFISTTSGVTAVVVDTTVPFNTALNDPSAYGAENATCYSSDGLSCLWYNNYHPGIAIHKLVAQAVASSFSSFF